MQCEDEIVIKTRKICCVPHCRSYTTKDISLHSFPTDSELKEKWRNILQITKPITKYMLVCCLHFEKYDYMPITSHTQRKRLKKGVVPSQKLLPLRPDHFRKQYGKQILPKPWTSELSASYSYTKVVKNKFLPPTNSGVEDQSSKSDSKTSKAPASYSNAFKTKLASIINSVVKEEFSNCDSQRNKRSSLSDGKKFTPEFVSVDNLAVENPSTTSQLNAVKVEYDMSTVSLFMNNKQTQICFEPSNALKHLLSTEEKLYGFTGVNRQVLNIYKNCVETMMISNGQKCENLELHIILVLCKLKTNLSFHHLSNLFGPSSSYCRESFKKFVNILATSIKPVIYWLSKSEIQQTMPKCFKKFKTTRVVLKYTEIRIQKPECFECERFSYSADNCHTIKFLIGITPSGLISHVSKPYGGKSSNAKIFKKERFIEKLEPQDAIIRDPKSTTISKECKKHSIKLIRPTILMRGKKILMDDTIFRFDIVRARAHAEKAVQRMKSFYMLQQELDWHLVPYIHDIMTIMAATINMSILF